MGQILKIYKGPAGSGKTTILKDKYQELAREVGTDRIMVLLQNAPSVRDWKNNLQLKKSGPLNIFTFFGLAQDQVRTYWPEVYDIEGLPVDPYFMNVETAHYIMTRIVEQRRDKKDYFVNLNSTSNSIAVQLIDNLNQAALNLLNMAELEARLLDWAADDTDKGKIFKEAILLMNQYRESCHDHFVIDYSLLIKLFFRLLKTDRYLKRLEESYDYLIVDELELTPPAAQKLIEYMLSVTQDSFMAYNPEGKINRFFGGNPKLAEKKFFHQAEIEELTEFYGASQEAVDFAERIKGRVKASSGIHRSGARNLEGSQKLADSSEYIEGRISSEFRGDMLGKVADEVIRLVETGVEPGDIGVIAPHLDKVLEFTFTEKLAREGLDIFNLLRSKRLIDIPYSQALLTLAQLVYPAWKLRPDFTSLQQTFVLLLDLDPVRGAILAERVIANEYRLPEIDQQELRERLGFKRFEEYNKLQAWIAEKIEAEIEVRDFFQQVFVEFLAPLSPDEEEIIACRQIIKSFHKFAEIIEAYNITDGNRIGKYFISMINKGTLAAEILNEPGQKIRDKVIVSTPYKFITSTLVDSVEYLFLLDTGSQFWFSGITKELLNPYVLSPQWNQQANWDDRIDRSLKQDQLLDNILSLIRKSSKGIYLATSLFDSRGIEQEGELVDWFI
ncbi:UvrD-helicase domain-containing protein [Halanaerobiaceae bacterium Z-7014]|uniref:UvrD-helicase domain-containing protein n=1 Tax=Halonatronomonas betaini TaxID=2778430 RepID=A0A931ATZ1_9FIRM|nr:UvrD-helicase domain-containing protein [Halonatronomonas betaini]